MNLVILLIYFHRVYGNTTVTDKKQIANKFNTYFSSVAENLNKDILDDHNTQTSDSISEYG